MEENVREMTKEEIREKLDLYKKLSQKQALRDEYEDTSESLAIVLKSLYDALLRIGFNDDQAFTILIATIRNGSVETLGKRCCGGGKGRLYLVRFQA